MTSVSVKQALLITLIEQLTITHDSYSTIYLYKNNLLLSAVHNNKHYNLYFTDITNKIVASHNALNAATTPVLENLYNPTMGSGTVHNYLHSR